MHVVRDVSVPQCRGQGPRSYAYVTVTYETVGCTASGQKICQQRRERICVVCPATYPSASPPCTAVVHDPDCQWLALLFEYAEPSAISAVTRAGHCATSRGQIALRD